MQAEEKVVKNYGFNSFYALIKSIKAEFNQNNSENIIFSNSNSIKNYFLINQTENNKFVHIKDDNFIKHISIIGNKTFNNYDMDLAIQAINKKLPLFFLSGDNNADCINKLIESAICLNREKDIKSINNHLSLKDEFSDKYFFETILITFLKSIFPDYRLNFLFLCLILWLI